MPLSDGTFKVSNEKFWRKNFSNYTGLLDDGPDRHRHDRFAERVRSVGHRRRHHGCNQETIVKSVETFTLPFRVQFAEMQSQRIANQEFYLGVVDSAGHHVRGVAVRRRHHHAGQDHPRGGRESPTRPARPARSPSPPPRRPPRCCGRSRSSRTQVLFHDRTVDSNGRPGRTGWSRPAPRWTRRLSYYVRIRVKNLGDAPATSTTYTVENVSVEREDSESPLRISAGRGQNTLSQSLPVTHRPVEPR
jgi:hypothetical protein